MPKTYTIESLGQKALWENEQNKGDYPVVLAGHPDREVLVFHDASSNYDPPKVGDDLFGDVEKDKRGRLRFRRASKKDAGASGGRGGGGQRDDATGQSIERQTAAKCAAEMACAAAGHPTDVPNPGVMVANFEGFFDAIVAKIHGVASKPAQEIPADTNGLEPQSQVADASIPF